MVNDHSQLAAPLIKGQEELPQGRSIGRGGIAETFSPNRSFIPNMKTDVEHS
jgi:hypothetical protein